MIEFIDQWNYQKLLTVFRRVVCQIQINESDLDLKKIANQSMLHGALRNEVAFTFVFVKARISWLFDEEKKILIEKKSHSMVEIYLVIYTVVFFDAIANKFRLTPKLMKWVREQ